MKKNDSALTRLWRRVTTQAKLLLAVATTASLLSFKTADGTFTLKGFVKDETGNGIAGVVVNNGVNFTVTDKRGAWTLLTDTTASKFVSISTPKEYHLPESDGLAAGFYIPVSEAAAHRDNNVFVLNRRETVSDMFHYIAISDPQILNAHDMKRWRNETVADIMRTAASLRKTGEVVGMTLGDLVFDNMSLYPQYAASLRNKRMTVFQCIGNHDFNKTYADLHRQPQGASEYAEKMYGEYFGPVNYSFNIGKTHIVTMKNINYEGRCKYEEEITDTDMEWLRRDLSYVPKDVVVILNMHAPAWNNMEKIDNILNADRLAEVLSTHDTHVFCGHTHFFENVEVTPRLYQHNIAAACGAWWTSDLNRDGAPNGYMVVDVYGRDLKWHYKGANHKADYTMRVYKPGEFASQPGYVVANVWDCDRHSRVVWYEDGKYKGQMQQFTDNDADFLLTRPLKHQLCKTQHLFRAKPSSKTYRTIKVVTLNRFGETSSYTIVNRNNRPFLLDTPKRGSAARK